MPYVNFQILTDDQIEEIKRASFEVMAKVGFKVLHEDARAMLKKAGAVVSEEIAKVPEDIVEECLKATPKGWTIFDREGQEALDVSGRNVYYGTSTASPNTMHALTGEIHPTRVEDIAIGAIIADALPNIDWVMPFGSVQDVPSDVADLYEFEAVVTNTTKPVVFIGYTPHGVELVYEMAAEVAGGLDNLKRKPFLIFYPESISPLVFPEDVVSRLFVCADLGMPQMQGPAIQPGATGPVTLAGAIIQGLAESLMCLVLAQLRKPGCPCGLGCNFAIFDMATGLLAVGAPEMSLALAAYAEVARSFGLPTWGLAGATDAKVPDLQAGSESAFSILTQGLAGLNLIHDVGYMDGGMICSATQLVLGDENIGMAKRFMKGIEVNRETLGVDTISKVGPGGNFLVEDHTLKFFRQEIWAPKLMMRKTYDMWKSEGSKDTTQRIKEKIKEILENHKISPLPDNTIAALEKIRQKGER